MRRRIAAKGRSFRWDIYDWPGLNRFRSRAVNFVSKATAASIAAYVTTIKVVRDAHLLGPENSEIALSVVPTELLLGYGSATAYAVGEALFKIFCPTTIQKYPLFSQYISEHPSPPKSNPTNAVHDELQQALNGSDGVSDDDIARALDGAFDAAVNTVRDRDFASEIYWVRQCTRRPFWRFVCLLFYSSAIAIFLLLSLVFIPSEIIEILIIKSSSS